MTAEPNRLALVPNELGPLRFVTDFEPLPLVGPTEAARFLNVARHTLACYRCLGDGPPYYKFGRWIRYAREDLRQWRDGIPALRGFALAEPESECVWLVVPAVAARVLTITLSCLSNYRIKGIGPRYLRYSNRIHYPVHELRSWAERQRHPDGEQLRYRHRTNSDRIEKSRTHMPRSA